MTDYNVHWNTGDDENEDEAVDEYFSTSEAFLFLIEATDTMLEPTSPETQSQSSGDVSESTMLGWKSKRPAQTKMELCLRCALAMMRRKVISSPKDKIGVMVFNTATSSNRTGSGNYQLVQPLELVTAKAIKDLKELLEDASRDPDVLKTKFAPNRGQNTLPAALSQASTILRERAASSRINKHIMLITDNDNPFQDVEQLGNVAMSTRADYADLLYTFDGTFIDPNPEKPFDLNKFYGTLIAGDNLQYGEWPTVVQSLTGVLNDLLGKLRTKEATKRVAFKLPFILADGFRIGINGYALVGDEKKRPPVKVDLHSRTGQELLTEVVYKDSMTGDALEPAEIKKYFAVGKNEGDKKGAKIFFNDYEVRKLKTLGMDPCLKLLGFAPRQGNVHIRESVKHSYFIYPEEETYIGSTRTFAALIKSMIRKDVVGYAVLLARVISRPQICLLMAQEEEMRADGTQAKPAGIHVIQLPFADDLRELGLESTNSVIQVPEGDLSKMDLDDLPDQPSVRMFTKIIKKLNQVYNPDNYPNPALNFHYETLAAFALDEDLPDPEDKTLPRNAQIDMYAGEFIAEIRKLINQDELVSGRVEVSKSRNIKSQIQKVDDDSFDLKEFAELLKTSGQTKIKNDEIKQGLKAMNEKVTGTKAVLWERAKTALESRGLWT
ncbi:ATP-dependent DNA helicase II subunit 1 [Microbotryomycetes sp. JL221]|nr:ATP-dependent DNA helicase II subunit 1 [Microbotryomycetes sp. JL221]